MGRFARVCGCVCVCVYMCVCVCVCVRECVCVWDAVGCFWVRESVCVAFCVSFSLEAPVVCVSLIYSLPDVSRSKGKHKFEITRLNSMHTYLLQGCSHSQLANGSLHHSISIGPQVPWCVSV